MWPGPQPLLGSFDCHAEIHWGAHEALLRPGVQLLGPNENPRGSVDSQLDPASQSRWICQTEQAVDTLQGLGQCTHPSLTLSLYQGGSGVPISLPTWSSLYVLKYPVAFSPLLGPQLCLSTPRSTPGCLAGGEIGKGFHSS